MLEEYKELCKSTADLIPSWELMTKNELCRAYVANKDNKFVQNAYFSAILCKYWNLISRYYHMSENCTTPEECYGWLVDSVACCVNLASWEDPKSSIYGDPNGPDKVINRCMKCARLTYYQFINRKKRKNDFGALSIEEFKDTYGCDITDLQDPDQDIDISSMDINDYVIETFNKKDYFVAFMLDCILNSNVFDEVKQTNSSATTSALNVRKLCTELRTINDNCIERFSELYDIPLDDVKKAYSYVSMVPVGNVRTKVLHALETLKHSKFMNRLKEVTYVD